ncbi:type IV pilin [Halostella sp. JP-L12]|uniref:type IV pilin n=1 Tax=Halostella TaxID=1843185 RepID=UPI000EF782B5|nr:MULTISPECIES: type IV pilin N-terminal domain-containing protein [Halostella]NHN47187.1 type IV pilin [Halostella sp. JP-L12]
MNIKNLFTDDDAVSPVIGAILMVAITVILAAVIGAFVLDLGGSQEKTPQTSFDADWNQSSTGNNVTITQESGDSIEVNRINFVGNKSNQGTGWNQISDGQTQAGSYVGTAVESGGTVRVVWESESGETSSTIAEFENPN